MLAALAWADDIIVVDSLSTDKTVAIAQDFGARVMEQKFLGCYKKRLAIAQAKHDWVLNIDADEILDEEAQRAIQALPLAEMDANAAFAFAAAPSLVNEKFVMARGIPIGVCAYLIAARPILMRFRCMKRCRLQAVPKN